MFYLFLEIKIQKPPEIEYIYNIIDNNATATQDIHLSDPHNVAIGCL